MMMIVFLKSTTRPLPSVRATVVHDLQQDVEHIRMSFLDFVEEHNAVRTAANCSVS